jgi:DNA polymerase III subunit delta'
VTKHECEKQDKGIENEGTMGNQESHWDSFLGHEGVRARFRRAIEQGRLGGAYLLVGEPGVGKRTFALKLAQALLCSATPDDSVDACGTCPSCQQVAAGSNPDLIRVACPEDRANIPIKLLVGPPENRMREGFCYDISLKPYFGGRKVGIIEDADRLEPEGANSLLKTLEEPPPGVVLLLLATSLQRQLPTIRSRCQIVQFSRLTTPQVARILADQQLVESQAMIPKLAELSEGSLVRALEMLDPPLLEFRGEFLNTLSSRNWDGQQAAKDVVGFVEKVSKDTPPRRRRLRQLIGVATTYYREQLRILHGLDPTADDVVTQAAQLGARNPRLDTFQVTECLQRCLEAENQVAANANLSTLTESWLDDLCRLVTSDGPRQTHPEA